MQLYQTGHEKGYDWLLGTAPAASDAVSCYINQATLTRLFTLNEMIAPIDLSNSGTFHVLTARWWWYKNKWPEEKRAVRCSVAAKLVIRRAENSLCTNKYTVAGGSPRRWWRPRAPDYSRVFTFKDFTGAGAGVNKYLRLWFVFVLYGCVVYLLFSWNSITASQKFRNIKLYRYRILYIEVNKSWKCIIL